MYYRTFWYGFFAMQPNRTTNNTVDRLPGWQRSQVDARSPLPAHPQTAINHHSRSPPATYHLRLGTDRQRQLKYNNSPSLDFL